jgi:hypothetical protein
MVVFGRKIDIFLVRKTQFSEAWGDKESKLPSANVQSSKFKRYRFESA